MKNFYKAYDYLADVYELWSTGDPAYYASLDFYINQLKDIESPIAELGIGTGRIAYQLSRLYNKKIIGIDESVKMLEIVHKKYKDNEIENLIELICEDMSHFTLPVKVNAVYLPFRTIGHLLDQEQLIHLFQSVYDNLNIHGYFLFDHYIFSKEWAREHNKKRIKMYSSDTYLIEDYYEYDFIKQIMDCRIFINDKEQSRFFFSYHNPMYYIKLLSRTGFTIKQMYGEFDGTPFDNTCCNQIYICQKI